MRAKTRGKPQERDGSVPGKKRSARLPRRDADNRQQRGLSHSGRENISRTSPEEGKCSSSRHGRNRDGDHPTRGRFAPPVVAERTPLVRFANRSPDALESIPGSSTARASKNRLPNVEIPLLPNLSPPAEDPLVISLPIVPSFNPVGLPKTLLSDSLPCQSYHRQHPSLGSPDRKPRRPERFS